MIFDTHSKVGGYSITYILEGLAYCGDCIADEVSDDGHRELYPNDTKVTKGLTYHDDDSHGLDYAHKVTCETCNTTVSN